MFKEALNPPSTKVKVVGWTNAICAVLMLPISVAPFTPAIFVTHLTLVLAGVIAFQGAWRPAIFTFCVASLTVLLSPALPVLFDAHMQGHTALLSITIFAYLLFLAGVALSMLRIQRSLNTKS